MMKRLNKKGFTLTELIVSFVFVFTIVFAMYELLINYRIRQNKESMKANLIDYTNQITLMIQNDIIEKTLNNIDYCNINDDLIERCLVLTFNDGTSKMLSIENDIKNYDGIDYDISYIVYDGVIYESNDAIMLDYIYDTLLYNSYDIDDNENKNVRIYQISIPIEHKEIDGKYGVFITAVAYDYNLNLD